MFTIQLVFSTPTRYSYSMDLMCCVFVALVAYYLLYLYTRYPKHFPPHPRFSIPVLGDIIHMRKSRIQAFKRFRKKYGDIFGYMVGSRR